MANAEEHVAMTTASVCSDCQTYPWFAIRVRSNQEQTASMHLRQQSYEEFCPSYSSERQWSDRRKTTQRILFPGYVFCRMNPNDRLPVLKMPGVVGVVGFGSQPAEIPEQEIECIRRMVASGLPVSPWPFLNVGQTVVIERGPLKGVEGILEEVKNTLRLIVSVQMLQRSVSVEVDRCWARPIKELSLRQNLFDARLRTA